MKKKRVNWTIAAEILKLVELAMKEHNKHKPVGAKPISQSAIVEAAIKKAYTDDTEYHLEKLQYYEKKIAYHAARYKELKQAASDEKPEPKKTASRQKRKLSLLQQQEKVIAEMAEYV